jgi:hypothetical protein
VGCGLGEESVEWRFVVGVGVCALRGMEERRGGSMMLILAVAGERRT